MLFFIKSRAYREKTDEKRTFRGPGRYAEQPPGGAGGVEYADAAGPSAAGFGGAGGAAAGIGRGRRPD